MVHKCLGAVAALIITFAVVGTSASVWSDGSHSAPASEMIV